MPLSENNGHRLPETGNLSALSARYTAKGGEAEVVYLMPDLSVAGMQEYIKGGEGRDAVNRMFYVGIRARNH